MTPEAVPPIISILALIVWMLIITGGVILQIGGTTSLQAIVSQRIVYSLPIAAIFLLAVISYMGWWREVGLQPGTGINEPKILALPALAIFVIWSIAFSRGLPERATLIRIGINSLLVGFSEELVFRGLVFYGMQRYFGLKWGAITTALIFGVSHAINTLVTRNPKEAITQSVFATMFGVWIGALRVYINTIFPLIVIHWLWDFGLFVARPEEVAPSKAVSLGRMLPVVLEIILFAYGVLLLHGRF